MSQQKAMVLRPMPRRCQLLTTRALREGEFTTWGTGDRGGSHTQLFSSWCGTFVIGVVRLLFSWFASLLITVAMSHTRTAGCGTCGSH